MCAPATLTYRIPPRNAPGLSPFAPTKRIGDAGVYVAAAVFRGLCGTQRASFFGFASSRRHSSVSLYASSTVCAKIPSGETQMSKLATEEAAGYQPVRAPRGAALSCKGWQQEAALRMLMNNLDPEVAEKPEDLIIYGGRGKAARNWNAYHAIVASLRSLENDETLLVQSGKPVGIFRTHTYAPRVLIANSNLVGHWSD